MYREIYNQWVSSDKIDESDKKELESLTDEKDIEYRFAKDLEFGTAGMRGLIGLGTNMINKYTVMRATQALSEHIKSLGKDAMKKGVAISYDTRRKSSEFAYVSAIVLASNGIKTYLFEDVHPVPMLSFTVRALKAEAGIMITASHNPKEYNGYKVYGSDGAQMSPEATAKIVEYINEIGSCTSDRILFNEENKDKIEKIGKKVDKKYYKIIKKLCLSVKEIKAVSKSIKLVYTPVHGSGYIPVTTILKKIGITPILVPEQIRKDTEFSTVEVPNPEYKETLTLAIKKADFENADVVFGTDPDCDRLGVAVRNKEGEFEVLSGNQTGILLLDYVLRRLKERGELDGNGFVVKSFVTTGMAKVIAKDYGVTLFETPVGFKFIGEKIKEYDDTGKKKFEFGFEESCGYLRGTQSRDKDAVVASMLFAEMVCYYQYHGISIYERLNELYEKYGYVFDVCESKTFSGLDAMKNMTEVVENIKKNVPESFGGVKVLALRDYSNDLKKFADGREEKLNIPKNNAVYFELEGDCFICARPSGTEPKLKTYYSVKAENKQKAQEIYLLIKADLEKLIG